MKEKFRKWVIIFFMVMIILTIASRIINNMYIIKVTVGFAGEKEIAKTIEGSGRVRGKNEVIVVTEENLLVSKVYVAQGDEVEKGDALYELNAADMKKVISQKEAELKDMRRQLEAAKKQSEFEKENNRISLKHANENYEAAKKDKKKKLQQAKKDILSAREQQNKLESKLDKKRREYENRKAVADKRDAEELFREIKELEQEVAANKTEIAEKEQLYSQTGDEQESLIRAARQELEKAAVNTYGQSAGEQSEELIELGQRQLEELKAIAQKGKIVSPCDAVVKEVLVTTGARTGNGADFVLTDKNSGLEVVAQFPPEEKAFLKKGAIVRIDAGLGEDASATYPISSVSLSGDDMQALEVKVDIPASNMLVGSSVGVTLIADAIQYPTVIERNALHMDSDNKYYVFTIRERETLIGKELTAVKKEVEVVDKNEEYAAIEGVSDNDEIVLEASRYISDGDFVKKEEE